MADRAADIGSSSETSRGDALLATILAVAASLGLCMAFSFGYWVRGLIDRDGNTTGTVRPDLVFGKGGSTPRSQPARAADLGAEAVARPAADASAPGGALHQATTDKQPVPAVPTPKDPPTEVAASVSRPSAPEPFDLGESNSRPSAPFIVPDKPWFALADLKLKEPAACNLAKPVCAVDRSLNTALSWARSPTEAAARARAAGKLVFLMQVSGNFEDPGFT
jgi:hypothetical protein